MDVTLENLSNEYRRCKATQPNLSGKRTENITNTDLVCILILRPSPEQLPLFYFYLSESIFHDSDKQNT